MKKRNFRPLVLVITSILFLITSCNNITEDFHVQTGNSDKDIGYIKLGLQTPSARDIYPTINNSNFKDFVLSGKWQGQDSDRNLAFGDTWDDISGSDIPIQTGRWDFTLQATSIDNRSFKATLTDVDISTGTTTSLRFTLQAENNLGNFSISITVDKSHVSQHTNLQVQFTLYNNGSEKFSPGPQEYEGTAVTFSPANEYNFEPGDYDMEIKIIAENLLDSSDNSIILNTYTDKLHVIAGFNSTKNITITANPVYDILYEYNDGTISEGSAGPAMFSRKSATANLPTLEKTGYNFLGWFDEDSGGNRYEEVSITKVNYYARFTPESYNITLTGNEDTTVVSGSLPSATYNIESGNIELPSLSKTGYFFDGWYTDEDFDATTKVTGVAIPSGSIGAKTFHARFIDTIYIKTGGATYSNSADGTRDTAPLATVSDAIQKIYEYNTSGINWKIEVDGTITGNQTIANTITTDDAARITLQKKTGGTTAVLDGNNNGTVLTINTAVPVTLKNITIQNGYAEGDENFEAETSKGGGLYISSGSNVTIDIGTEICSNKAYSSGGGIYITGATLIMNGGTIGGASKANKARQGNGIFAQNSTITLNGGTISYNEYVDASDYGYEGGGGIYITGTQAAPSELTIEDGVNITYNKNNDNGGGVYAADYVTFIMNGGNISYNTVDTSYSAMGGGIKINNHSSFTMNNGIISHNSGMNGGGIVSTSNVTINDGEISYNKTTYNAPEVDGGGIIFLTYNDATEDITLSITGGTISHNEAISYGGGVLVDGNRTIFNMTGGSITENKTTDTGTGAFDGGGGAVYFQGKTFTMSGSASMTDNETGGCGGAIRFVTGTPLTISGGTISGNTAAYSCGGIDIEEGCTLNMSGGTVSGNTAGTSIGGVGCAEGSSTLYMSGTSLIQNNTASEGGGAIGGVDLYLSESAYIPVGTSHNNDVYLSGSLQLSGTLTPPEACTDGIVATLTPADYSVTTVIVPEQISHFAISPQANGTEWTLDEDGRLKKIILGSKTSPDAIGDIVFSDGSAIEYIEGLTLSDKQMNAAVAVIFYIGSGLNNTGDTSIHKLGIGLKKSPEKLQWAVNGDAPASGFAENITDIQCEATYDYTNRIYNYSGHSDGSTTLEIISAYLQNANLTDDTNDADKYPIFYFPNNYKNIATNIVGTECQDGWYIPTFNEMRELATNKSSIEDVISLLNGDQIFTLGDTWCATQFPDTATKVYTLDLGQSSFSYNSSVKSSSNYVIVIRQFN